MRDINNTATHIELLKITRAKPTISNRDYLWLSAHIFALEYKLKRLVDKLYEPQRIKGHDFDEEESCAA